MFKFIDLCVLLSRKSHVRLGLLTYKNTAQTSAVSSIESVLNRFIAQAEARLETATELAKSEVAALPENPLVDDELPLQPADMLLDSFVDIAGDRERIERRLISPAQKFCWDAYDISLDVSKGNDRLEVIYQSIAHRAFNFCKVHQRKSDFRRLCEQRLRKDLSNATKYGHQQHAVNLSDPETLTRHLDTRFLQLETAVELELWQEAFRSVEDVHGLVAGKKSAKPSMMANYYEKLTKIFKAEGGKQTAVFQAAAWARYLHHAERAGSATEKSPGCVLLSALAVPLGEIENKQRLIALLNLPKMPTREALIKDAAGKHLKLVSPDIRQLYNVLEVDFQPLKACKILAPLVASLAVEYQSYLPALHEVVLSRLVKELAQVYDTVSLAHILNLVKPFDGTAWETDMPALEKFLMTACRRGDIVASVDHIAKSITFTAHATDANRLSNLAVCLYNTIQYLQPVPVTSRAEAFSSAISQAEEERRQIAHRRQIVTKRRELMEEAILRQEKEESTVKAEQAKALAEKRVAEEKEAAKRAEMDRLQAEIAKTKRDEAIKLADELAAKGGKKIDLKGIEIIDTAQLVGLQVQQLAKEKRELDDRLRIVAKRVDHLERAIRKEERPLLAEDYERQKQEDKVAHEQANARAREQAIQHQKSSIEIKSRLSRMMPDYLVARQQVESQREVEFQAARSTAAKKVEEEKGRFKASVLARRKAEKERREQERLEIEEEQRQERGEHDTSDYHPLLMGCRARRRSSAARHRGSRGRSTRESRDREAQCRGGRAHCESQGRRRCRARQAGRDIS